MHKEALIAFLKKAVPDSLHDRILTFRRPYKKELQRNTRWKGVGRNRRAWVLATGPSISQQRIELLAGEECYSVSNFFLHEKLGALAPKAHFFAPYHPPLIRSNYLDWIASAHARLPATTPLILGLQDYEMLENSGILGARERYYLQFGARRFGPIDCTRAGPPVQTGPQMVLQLLLYAGYDEIFLLGCDHDTLKNYGDTVANFYAAKDDVRVNATNGLGWLPIVDHLRTQVRVFEIYDLLQRHNTGSRIINCSPVSWLRFTQMETRRFEDVVRQ